MDAAEPDPGPIEELTDCFTFWDAASETYPQLDLTVSQPTTRNVPNSPTELLIYAHGWNSEGKNGRDQAATFEHALRANGYEHPVVNAQWESDSFDLAEAGRRADECAHRLADWLRDYRTRHPDVTIRLAGLSLGARVPLTTLEALDGDVTVATVSLFGAAVDATWLCSNSSTGYDGAAIDASTGTIFNYYSNDDDTICTTYTIGNSNGGLGCDGADCTALSGSGSTPDAYVDVDVTDEIGGHCAYQIQSGGIVSQVVTDFRAADTAVENRDDR
ncbi:alpha/beta hydrolase [Natrinema halophilum]|uniref:Alpha/beta hydrolase n=1 Tax=Natrinema halophilum TaxID=1699371 RepID=A0A7D5GMQ2_9EURY|nr:alpha/beta hydrolase [Natrinema halophilum]QLG48753.1 alpha/beta hydrolase [Natrinema halophilum]